MENEMTLEQALEKIESFIKQQTATNNKNAAALGFHTTKMYGLLNDNHAWKGEENINSSRRILVSHIFAIDEIIDDLTTKEEN